MNRISPFLWFLFVWVGFSARLLDAADQPVMAETGTPPLIADLQPATTTVIPPPEPFIPPVGGTKLAAILSGFGPREVPGTPGKNEIHEGIDYGVTPGASIRASRSGKVLFAGFSTAYVSRKLKTEKHRLVIVRHVDGMSSRYVHLNSLLVKPMQAVSTTTVLGTAAESDEWKAPVLHFEIRDAAGKPLDPEEILSAPSVR